MIHRVAPRIKFLIDIKNRIETFKNQIRLYTISIQCDACSVHFLNWLQPFPFLLYNILFNWLILKLHRNLSNREVWIVICIESRLECIVAALISKGITIFKMFI